MNDLHLFAKAEIDKLMDQVLAGDSDARSVVLEMICNGDAHPLFLKDLVTKLRKAARQGAHDVAGYLAVLISIPICPCYDIQEAEGWLRADRAEGNFKASATAGLLQFDSQDEERWSWARDQLHAAASGGNEDAQVALQIYNRLQDARARQADQHAYEVERLQTQNSDFQSALRRERAQREIADADHATMISRLRLELQSVSAEKSALATELSQTRADVLKARLADLQRELVETRAETDRLDKENRRILATLNDHQRHNGYLTRLLRASGVAFNSTIGHGDEHPHEE